MKKVLALVMVLSMAGFASAALQIDVAGGKATVNGQLDADQYLILTAGNGAVLSNFALGGEGPSMSGFFMSAAEFEALGVGFTAPAGFAGEAWVMASAPGEAYKSGAQLMADIVFGSQEETKTWTEEIQCDKGYFIRTWTEVAAITNGFVSLSTFSEITGETAMAAEKDLTGRTVISSTFVDGECIPEPMTLSLLGLGALVLRRRS